MEFTFRAFKKDEFHSVVLELRDRYDIQSGSVVTYNREADEITALIDDPVIGKLFKEEIAELNSIK